MISKHQTWGLHSVPHCKQFGAGSFAKHQNLLSVSPPYVCLILSQKGSPHLEHVLFLSKSKRLPSSGTCVVFYQVKKAPLICNMCLFFTKSKRLPSSATCVCFLLSQKGFPLLFLSLPTEADSTLLTEQIVPVTPVLGQTLH